MIVIKATTKDIETILELYKEGIEELGIKDSKESYLLNKILVSFYLAPCFLLEIDGNIVGMAGFTVVTIPYNGMASLADYIFYVRKEYRNIKSLGALVEAAKGFAEDNNLPLRIDFTVNDDEEVRKRLMRKFGFKINSVSGVFNG